MSRKPNPAHRAGFRRLPRIADRMTPVLYDNVERSLAAERAGDAHAALEWHQSVPMFRRGRHRGVLTVLNDLGEDLPDWLWARWIVYQALRCEDGETGELMHAVLAAFMNSVHAQLLDECEQEGGDPIRVVARAAGESWLLHEFACSATDVVRSFVAEHATGALAEHAELAMGWQGSRVSGFRLGASLPGSRLVVREANASDDVEVLDLGARTCAGEQPWVIGRLVPSGVGDLLMFDLSPMGVSEAVARAVAVSELDPTDPLSGASWLVPLIISATSDLDQYLREDYELATDVLSLDLLRFGTPPRDLSRVMGQLRAGRDEIGRAAYRVLARVADGTVGEEDQACVAAAVLHPWAYDEARRRLAQRAESHVWQRWVDLVPDPARRRLLSLSAAA